jgi:hypothetical protein
MGIWRLKDVRGNTVLYAGKRKEGITSCNVKEEGTGGGGQMVIKRSSQDYTRRLE